MFQVLYDYGSYKIITCYSSTKNIFSLSSPVGHSPSRLLSNLTASRSVLERTYLLDHYVVNPQHSFVRRSHRISLNTRNQLLVHLQNESTLGIRNCQDLFSATLFSVLGFNCRGFFFLFWAVWELQQTAHLFHCIYSYVRNNNNNLSLSVLHHIASRWLNPVKFSQFFQTFPPFSYAFSHPLHSLKVPVFSHLLPASIDQSYSQSPSECPTLDTSAHMA